jgi:hypothetical protein
MEETEGKENSLGEDKKGRLKERKKGVQEHNLVMR